jgi:hypothetical protein
MRVGPVCSVDEEMTIYAERPFTISSRALVDLEPDYEVEEPDYEVEDLPLEGALLPEQAKAEGLAYLIEIEIAKDVIENLRITASEEPDTELRLQAVLHYREHDAYM